MLEFSQQPHFGQSPITLHRLGRDLESVCSFFNDQSSQVPQLHHTTLSQVELSQNVQRVIQRHQIGAAFLRDFQGFVERDLNRAAAAFEVFVAAREINQNASHQLSRDGEEVRAVL